MVEAVHIGHRRVGAGAPCFVIAEAGVNHNGDPAMARKLIEAAAAAGADAVKFQTFSADRLASGQAPKASYQRAGTADGESQLEMLRRLELPEAAHVEMAAHARCVGIEFLSSPFDEESADLLTRLGVRALKIPSGEITNLPFLAHVATAGLPLIVSTGMSTLDDVTRAVETIRRTGNDRIVLLHCVSNYPADPGDANLRAMATLETAFGVPVGYSDHTEGVEVALAAVALGAVVIEKHFTLDRKLPGPDHRASLEPADLTGLVRGVRTVERALGDGHKRPSAAELETASVARRSLVAAVDLAAGTLLADHMIVVRRPGTGAPPAARATFVGRRLRHDVKAGTPLTPQMLA